jgi:tRNA threonylcarbamoyladenosine biosynthesis protein TsaE
MQKVPLEELPYFVRNVLAVVGMEPPKQSATLIALRGELGAGKTTFTQTLARELGITETLQSPTYVLMKSYPVSFKNPFPGIEGRFDKLVHIDAYRLERAEEFAALKPETFLADPKALVVVEWPEKVKGALPEPDVTVVFSSENASETERFVEMQNTAAE